MTTPKKKASKVMSKPKTKPKVPGAVAKPKLPSASNVPEWRARHNKQRKLQQVSQNVLLGKQQIEMFESSMSKCSDAVMLRYENLLAELLELDSTFMSYMKDEVGIVAGNELSQARSFVVA